MIEISEKNTKAEILAAYKTEQVARLRLESELENAPMATIGEKPVTVCIPYVKEFAQGNELQLALRSYAKYFKENFNMVVIGDSEPWMNELVEVIECERIGKNPPIDIANKMLLAIESNLVSEKFIWANDDQYLVSPCMMADFEILKYTGQLQGQNFGSDLYQQNKKRTYEYLKGNDMPTLDFSIHLPFVFEKQKLKTLIEELNLTEEAYLISSMYFNYFFPGYAPQLVDDAARTSLMYSNIKIGIYRQNPDMDLVLRLLPGKKFIANSQSGWNAAFSKFMNGLLPEKCLFEK
jgi:hypothetical protein